MELVCREGTLDDAKLLFDWTNEITVRQNSLNNRQISWNEHISWLKKRLESSDSKFFIFEQQNIAVGQVRIDFKDEECCLNYSVDTKFRGIGIGTLMVKTVVDKLENCKLKALVKEDNVASGKVFERLGFSETDPLTADGRKIRVFFKYIE